MSGERTVKIVKAVTVVCVIVGFLLALVAVYQCISIYNLKKRIKAYNEALEEYERLLEESENDLDYYRSSYYLEQLARSYGYSYPEDKS